MQIEGFLLKAGLSMMQVTDVPVDRKLYRGLGGMILPDQVDFRK
jgi:hypothetical protein